MGNYSGAIVEESLVDSRILNKLKIKSVKITKEDSPQKRWHIYEVVVSEEEIKLISKNLKATKWYAHFWRGKNIIAVFKDKIFNFNYDKKETWKPVVEYGLSIGIPQEQLDFQIK